MDCGRNSAASIDNKNLVGNCLSREQESNVSGRMRVSWGLAGPSWPSWHVRLRRVYLHRPLASLDPQRQAALPSWLLRLTVGDLSD